MGPTGSGKSTVSHSLCSVLGLLTFLKFIETVTGIRGIVGDGLESCTNKIAVFKISFPELPGFDIHFVDTPGFDDTTKSDVDIFKMISDWLHNTCVDSLMIVHKYTHNGLDTEGGFKLRACSTFIEFQTIVWQGQH